MYLDQPFDDYCITRKELLDLLRRHHKTTIELEREKEEKRRYVPETWCLYYCTHTYYHTSFSISADFKTSWMPRNPYLRGTTSLIT